MRIVDVGGELVVVSIRESERAQHIRAVYRRGEAPELVVPAGTPDRVVDSALREYRGWIGRQLEREPPRVLDLQNVRIGAAEGRRLAAERTADAAERDAKRVGVEYGRIAIRDQRTLWGSCSPSGTLSFNWRLVLAPRDVLEYVVVHELCHLRVRGHSPRFWRTVERARPTFRQERAWLRDHGWELLAYRPRD